MRARLDQETADAQCYLHVNGGLADIKERKRKRADKAAKEAARKKSKKEEQANAPLSNE